MARKRISDTDLVLSTGSAASAARRKPATAVRKKRAALADNTPASAVSADGEASRAVVPVSDGEPSYEQIAQLAYSYWEARGCQGGSSEEDWLRAEDELRANRAAAATA